MLWWFLHALTWIRHGCTCDVSWKECKVMWTSQLTREEAKSDQCAALLRRDGHGSCFRSRTRAPATCQERLVEAGLFSVSCLRLRGRTSCLFSERAVGGNPARAMLPPSGDTEWLLSPCRLLSLELQEMTSPLIIVNVNWDDDRCRKLNHGSLRASRALLWSLSWFSRWYPHYKHWKEHSASAGQGIVWSTAVHLTPVSRKLLISEADPEADVIFLSICSGILSLPWLLAFAFLWNTWTLY